MKFSMVSMLLVSATVSRGGAQTLRGAPKATARELQLTSPIDHIKQPDNAGFGRKEGHSCGIGTEGVEFETQQSSGSNFWFEHRCADKCSEDPSCLAYEYSKNRGDCKFWRGTPAPVSDYPWITCGVKGEIRPTSSPTNRPTMAPTAEPTPSPTKQPTSSPTNEPTAKPTEPPTNQPTDVPTTAPTSSPTAVPTAGPTETPTANPTRGPSASPTNKPTNAPTRGPTATPTTKPTTIPTATPTAQSTSEPTVAPTAPHRLNKSEWTAYMNAWTSSLSAQFYQPNGETAAICGVSSHHSNWYEDRRFRFKYCTPENPARATLTGTTGYSTFDDHFYVDCGGDSFISSIDSLYNSFKGDRKFKYSCHQFEGYSTGMCSWTDWVNRFDSEFNFECGDQQVVSGMDTYHSNFREDRRFRFKCCRLNKD